MLERGLGSKGKLRIIISLSKNPEGLSKYMLERLTGIRGNSLSKDISTLLELKWICEETNHIRKYRLCFENNIIKCLLEFFREVGAL